jgi:hypothetical protein
MPDAPAPTLYRPLPTSQVRLSGGVLADRCRKNIENLFMSLDVEAMKEVYATTHGEMFAEPEFCGHYLDTAMQVFGTTGDPEALDRARALVDAIIRGQRADGYLGTYHEGLEFGQTFSVWNQSFTIRGLLTYYEGTGDERALEAAGRCADYVARAYLQPDGPDLLLAGNQGVQHACILDQVSRLYLMTGEQLHLDFCQFIVRKLESSAIKVLTVAHPIGEMGCWKAIEMMVLYQGVLRLYRATGDEAYLEATRRYWSGVEGTQVGITGNGSIGEMWTYLCPARRALSLSTDLNPNENCVAVGWMKLSAALYELLGDPKYVDALEKSLYNHLLGAQALDGSDFSYYQGTRGRKVHATHPGQYSCCRYRGMNMLAHLPRHVYAEADDALMVNLYCSSTAEASVGGRAVAVTQETDYPRTGRVALQVRAEGGGEFALALRMPGWCPAAEVTVNGQQEPATPEDGYIRLAREWSPDGDRVELELRMPVGSTPGRVEERDVAAVTYGPLVLALDSRYGVPIEGTELVVSEGECRPAEAGAPDALVHLVRFESPGRHRGEPVTLTLVDYASAGSVDPERDRFRTWLPTA